MTASMHRRRSAATGTTFPHLLSEMWTRTRITDEEELYQEIVMRLRHRVILGQYLRN